VQRNPAEDRARSQEGLVGSQGGELLRKRGVQRICRLGRLLLLWLEVGDFAIQSEDFGFQKLHARHFLRRRRKGVVVVDSKFIQKAGLLRSLE